MWLAQIALEEATGGIKTSHPTSPSRQLLHMFDSAGTCILKEVQHILVIAAFCWCPKQPH